MGIFNIILVFACVAPLTVAEIFTSMAQLEEALYAEKDLAYALRLYIQNEEARLSKLKRTADDYETHSNLALQNPEKYIANPIEAFLFVKKFTQDWDRDIASLFATNQTQQDLLARIAQYRRLLPNEEDFEGAVLGLIRLQDTYQLETTRLAEGDINGIHFSELTAEECYTIGKYAYFTDDFYHTYLWMRVALAKESFEQNKTVARSDILDYCAYATARQGNIRHALSLTKELLKIEPNHERARNNKDYYERIIADEERKEGKRGDDGEEPIRNQRLNRRGFEFETYEALCRGEDIIPIKDAHKLKCRYQTNNNHPLLILNPAKLEEVHLRPWIVFYHDFLSDAKIETVKSLAMPKLNRATVNNPVTGKLETASYRVSKSAWLDTSEHPHIDRIVKRIEAITGLNMNTAEELQVANYGIGGHYEPHHDFSTRKNDDAFSSLGTGNRIATWLNYMSDVTAGGATVFPKIGVKLFPKKGVSAFWYNLYKSGEGIFETRHAACPVLVGQKWVSTKWIHERGQEYRRPCSIDPTE